ncbi:6-O-methylguanine DNA methyltransferase [Aspergillus welwitschiae]|uniref:6-O-methylguanine DNA methyltransferase n=1 Tax=Aspergillus welwitschiae TaxID=1341132 RepID=A0A3F3QGB1_9EURO|nr:6-O-methylguanine DNA methyltransferase [Aspergillus welwitschiae]RDH38201.1 6-O-methylguanine DNA methyltransferase [Aspergillus welwitschiae]
MPRTDEAEHFINAVYSAVQEIPPGRVTTYGHIATLLGYPKRPRQVGISLKHLPAPETDNFFHSGNVPWQRVINSRGMISHREPGSAERQAEALRAEGVEVEEDSMGEWYVDFRRYGWFPDVLPSEDSEGDHLEGDEGIDR